MPTGGKPSCNWRFVNPHIVDGRCDLADVADHHIDGLGFADRYPTKVHEIRGDHDLGSNPSSADRDDQLTKIFTRGVGIHDQTTLRLVIGGWPILEDEGNRLFRLDRNDLGQGVDAILDTDQLVRVLVRALVPVEAVFRRELWADPRKLQDASADVPDDNAALFRIADRKLGKPKGAWHELSFAKRCGANAAVL